MKVKGGSEVRLEGEESKLCLFVCGSSLISMFYYVEREIQGNSCY